ENCKFRFRKCIVCFSWAILEVETFDHADEITQAFAAGLLEGILTRQLITYHFHNTVEGMCDGKHEYCVKLYKYLLKNLNWIKETVNQKPKTDVYWKQYFSICSMLQLAGDLIDLTKLFGISEKDSSHCSGLIKIAPNNSDLFVAHVAMSGYNTMNRVLKLYKFAYKVPGYATSFSSYAGTLNSVDDFILSSSGLAAIETTFAIFNVSLYNNVKSTGHTASEWVKIFSRYNSGTYNNQWSLVDYKLFIPGKQLPTHGLLWVLEQTPGLTVYHDMTWYLRKHAYWPSYNIPYFAEINKISGYKEKSESMQWYNWTSSPRAKIFDRDHNKVINMSTLQKLMRYNDYTHDEFSKCHCIPPYTAEAAISTRGDLNPANGTYEIESMGHRNHGDIKANHDGQPTEWKFEEIETQWECTLP
ncbi:unnamed protein product, partial [Thelazia callipaeda]|uniref:Phospholipase B-like n=1 Tax=Thelazia callipaeda TaxID=103827 RepID=A0A0N5CXK4_THECL